ncbi:MAG: transporter substrate-binding domain-containing protein [Propionibacteriaceae bacterium]|jgi:polar amino acid transport system substrate-binding protein|nr:transporter substrate-binding domain-containing protein [Propionibacteriaceae bacterium]
MNHPTTKRLAFAALAFGLAGTLAACGTTLASDPATGGASSDAGASSAVTVTDILVGTAGGPKPYLWLDDDNEVTGYDAAVVRAIDEYLPEYSFSYEVTEFASIFAGIDSGRYQMGDNNLTKKPEREEKYLFGKEPYVYNWTVVVVPKGNPKGIKTLEDLAGKSVYLGDSGGFSQLFIESFNEDHADNPIKIVYTGAEAVKQLLDLADGVIDFSFLEVPMYDNYLEEYTDLDGKLEYIQLSQEETQKIQDPYGWFIFQKNDDGQRLADRVDEAIRALSDSGELVELSNEFFGFDMTGR